MEKTIKLVSKVTTFEEVQKSLQTLENKLNELVNSTNKEIRTEFKETEGKPGDLRVFPNANQTYSLEACTDEGWKKLYASNTTTTDGTSEVYLDSKPKNTAPKRVAELFDSRYLPTVPDYDSGWFEIVRDRQYVTGGTDSVAPNSSGIFSAAYVRGIPSLGFTFNTAPSRIEVLMGPSGIESWSDIDGTANGWVIPAIYTDRWQGESDDTRIHGMKWFITSNQHLAIVTSSEYLFQFGDSGGSADSIAIELTTASLNVRIWK